MTSKIIDDVQQPDARTCQSAAIARLLGTQDSFGVRVELDRIAERRKSAAGDPWVMGEFLAPRVKEYRFDDKASLNDFNAALDEGYHLITHGWFTQYGHVIGISGRGYQDEGGWHLGEREPQTGWLYYRAEDPWYEYDFVGGRFTRRSGNDAPYSAYGMFAYCVASWSYPGAREIYLRGQLDSAQKGAWLHMVKN